MTTTAEIRMHRECNAKKILKIAESLQYTAHYRLTGEMRTDLMAAVETINNLLLSAPYVSPLQMLAQTGGGGDALNTPGRNGSTPSQE
jgi:hypothetical protein